MNNGLTQEDFKVFNDLLIKANKMQLTHMLSAIAQEVTKR
jgi:hypothetical protein